MSTEALRPRACLWSGKMFVPARAGQLFFDREAAEEFEKSGFQAIIVVRTVEQIFREQNQGSSEVAL